MDATRTFLISEVHHMIKIAYRNIVSKRRSEWNAAIDKRQQKVDARRWFVAQLTFGIIPFKPCSRKEADRYLMSNPGFISVYDQIFHFHYCRSLKMFSNIIDMIDLADNRPEVTLTADQASRLKYWYNLYLDLPVN